MIFGFPIDFLGKEEGGIALAEGCAYKLKKPTAFHSRLSHLQDMLVFFVHISPVHVE